MDLKNLASHLYYGSDISSYSLFTHCMQDVTSMPVLPHKLNKTT